MEIKSTAPERQPVAFNDAQRAVMQQRTPPEAVRTRQGRGGRQFRYVTHAYVTRTLNQAFGWNWDFEVIDTRIIPEDKPQEVIIRGRLTVHAKHGTIVKEQFGSSAVKRSNGQITSLGDDLKAATSDALKKCASLLGLALDLYES
jgi:recombination DNA repair RAD52 pathway protein